MHSVTLPPPWYTNLKHEEISPAVYRRGMGSLFQSMTRRSPSACRPPYVFGPPATSGMA